MKRADRKKAVRAWQAEHDALAKSQEPVQHVRWFFVVHLAAARRSTAGAPYEVQRLDERGRAIEVAHFDDAASPVTLRGEVVPTAVLRSAMELPEGEGCYVDEAGWEVSPFGHRLAADQARATGGQGPAHG